MIGGWRARRAARLLEEGRRLRVTDEARIAKSTMNNKSVAKKGVRNGKVQVVDISKDGKGKKDSRDSNQPSEDQRRTFTIDGKKIVPIVIGTTTGDPSEGDSPDEGQSSPPSSVNVMNGSNNADDGRNSTHHGINTILEEGLEGQANSRRNPCPLCLSPLGSCGRVGAEGVIGAGSATGEEEEREERESVVVTECGHIFCGGCLEVWGVEKVSCIKDNCGRRK